MEHKGKIIIESVYQYSHHNDESYFSGKLYVKSGVLHREDGPAIEYDSGLKIWYQNGLRHRDNGLPAYEEGNEKSWWVNGKRHREDGPAIEYHNGTKQYWIDDKQLTEEQFNARKNSCDGKVVEIEGKKYKLVEVVG